MNATPPAPALADSVPLYDPASGLLSRAAVLEALGRTLSMAARLQHPVTVLFIEIDGHEHHRAQAPERADTMERTLARQLVGRMRVHDVLAHWARGQFVAVLPDADVASALVLAEDLRTLAQTCASPGVTVSIGIHGRTPSATQAFHGLAADMVVDAQRALEATVAEGPNRLAIEPAPQA